MPCVRKISSYEKGAMGKPPYVMNLCLFFRIPLYLTALQSRLFRLIPAIGLLGNLLIFLSLRKLFHGFNGAFNRLAQRIKSYEDAV
jgi:hypothetical protein